MIAIAITLSSLYFTFAIWREHSLFVDVVRQRDSIVDKFMEEAFRSQDENSQRIDTIIQKVETLFLRGRDTISLDELIQSINDTDQKVYMLLDSLSHYKALFTAEREKYNHLCEHIIEQRPKVDSALLLLPYFRQRLEYDTINKLWKIKVPISSTQ